jgi:ABC-2 type transport system permease protein
VHKILLIAKRDFIETIRTKEFLIGLILLPILFGGGGLGMALVKDKPDTRTRRIAVLDRTGRTAATVIQSLQAKSERELTDNKAGRQVKPRYEFETVAPQPGDPDVQRLALSDRVRRGELFAFLEIGSGMLRASKESDPEGRIGYFTNAGGIDEMRQWLSEPLTTGVRKVRLAQAGIEESRLAGVFDPVRLDRLDLVSRDEKTGEIRPARKKSELESFMVPFAMMMLLGMIVIAGSGRMLVSVATDKSGRIYEMLLVAASPFELMMGKMLASLAAGLTSSAFYVIGGTLVLTGMGLYANAPLELLPWFYVYLIADSMILASLACAIGAASDSPQAAQSLALVVMAPAMIPLFVFMPLLRQPNGTLATALSLFPPFTPMLMLLRQATPAGVPAWQPWVGLVGVIVFALAVVWGAARIFRIAILMQGKMPRMAELLRWAVRG